MTDESQTSPRRVTGRRRVLFFVVAAGLCGGLVEMLALAGLHSAKGDFSFQRLHHDQASIANGAYASDGASEVIHPYLGWVHNPQTSEPQTIFGRKIPVSNLGFQDDSVTVQKRSADKFLIGIAGGSVAWHVSIAGAEAMRSKLQQHPVLAHRKIEFIRLAMSGYKQPQQVMALNYVQILGGEFDAVVNIDGYNEVALTLSENADRHTAIAYPRAWHARSITALDPRSFEAADRVLRLRAQRQSMARRMQNSWFRWSPTASLIWMIRDQRARSELVNLGMDVVRTRSGSFVNHGPADNFRSQAEADRATVDLWRNSSLQLARICAASNTLYLHVLQPNQYLPGSKDFSPEELKSCYTPSTKPAVAITRVYPHLREQAAAIQALGVQFSDQTLLFQDIREPIYVDPYCHYNTQGNILLAEAVARELSGMLRDE